MSSVKPAVIVFDPPLRISSNIKSSIYNIENFNIFNSNNRYLAIAEEKGQKIYLIENKEIKWEQSIEGNISQINVNKNGYVSVILSGTSYKSIIVTFSPEGKELFKTYLSSFGIDEANADKIRKGLTDFK